MPFTFHFDSLFFVLKSKQGAAMQEGRQWPKTALKFEEVSVKFKMKLEVMMYPDFFPYLIRIVYHAKFKQD